MCIRDRVIRTGDYTYTIEAFSDEFQTTLGSKQTINMGSENPTGLQYVVINIANDSSSYAYRLSGKIADLEIYDSTTSVTPLTQAPYIVNFDGTMDEFVVKDTADTASEVLAAYEMADFTKYSDTNLSLIHI